MKSEHDPVGKRERHHASVDENAAKHHEAHHAAEPPAAPDHEHHRDCERGHHSEHAEHPSRIVERTWYFDNESECEKYHCECECHRHEHDHNHCHGHCHWEHHADCECPCHRRGRRPSRPTRPPGKDTGRVGQGGPLTPGDINNPNPPGVWVGPRAQMDLPYLFMRANPGDLGARPVVGAPFWESPDIFILGGVAPALAPPVPAQLGQIAVAGQPNTIYAHVWNFGNAAASEVVVEFYWVDPSLGISADSVHLIAQTFTSLGAKGSGRAHTVVKCPEAWIPTFVNGGHECLLVRVWDNPSDLPGEPKFDASINRHVGQRNIHVNPPPLHMLAAHVAGVPSPALNQPLTLRVGPLYGAPAKVAVERVAPAAVPWLQLHTGKRGVFPVMATPTGVPMLYPPTTAGGGFPTGPGAAEQNVNGDDQNLAFHTTDNAPGPGEAHVYRVSATQAGAVFGGYTIVLLG